MGISKDRAPLVSQSRTWLRCVALDIFCVRWSWDHFCVALGWTEIPQFCFVLGVFVLALRGFVIPLWMLLVYGRSGMVS